MWGFLWGSLFLVGIFLGVRWPSPAYSSRVRGSKLGLLPNDPDDHEDLNDPDDPDNADGPNDPDDLDDYFIKLFDGSLQCEFIWTFCFKHHVESKVSICLRIKIFFESKDAIGRKLFSTGFQLRLQVWTWTVAPT